MAKAKTLRILLTLVCFIYTLSAYSQSLTGKVLDATTKEPLIGATVSVKETSLGTITDDNGEYNLVLKSEGSYTIVASYIGYTDIEEDVVLGEEALQKDFMLLYGAFDLNEVVVTIQAKGQMKAINQQVNSRAISNIVSSERIQEVPDATAADAIGRLPGVSVQAEDGEGNKVLIRGMEPRFNLITINGVRAPSFDETDNSVGLAGISPFTIDGIEIQKSLTPDKDGDVVGGIVDLKLKEAEEGFHTNVIFQNSTNSLNKESRFNPMITLQVGNRFFDNKLGVLVVANYENVDRSSHRMSASISKIQDLETSDSLIDLGGAEFYHSILTRERFGGSVFADYKLKNGNIKYNVFVNGLSNHGIQRKDLTGDRHIISYSKENTIWDESSLSFVNNLSFEHRLFWNSTLQLDLSYTRGKKVTPEKYYMEQNYIWADTSSVFDPETEYLMTSNNVQAYELSDLFVQLRDSNYCMTNLQITEEEFIEDELSSSINWKVPYAVFGDKIWGEIKVGGKYRAKNREFDRDYRSADLTVGGAELMRAQIIELNPEIRFDGYQDVVGQNLTSNNILDRNYSASIHDGKFIMRGFAEEKYIRQIIDRLDEAGWSSLPGAVSEYKEIPDDYSGNEQTLAAYGMMEINFKEFVQFVGGARYEKLNTDYRSYGIEITAPNAGVIMEFGDDLAKQENAYLLPMFNMKISPVKWASIRLAYTHSLARPRYYSYMPRYYLNRIGSLSNLGNPGLLPALSKNIDAYVSFRSNKLGLLTIGWFHKTIEGYEFVKAYPILDPSSNEVHPYYGDPYNIVATNTNSKIYLPMNNPYDAYTSGLEFDWQTVFWYLPGPLKGLVFNINYTFLETEQTETRVLIEKTIPDPSKPWEVVRSLKDTTFIKPLYEQPKGVLNVSLGYDYKGFSARLAYNMRTKTYLGIEGSTEFVESEITQKMYDQWDLSIRQKIPWVEGMQVFLNATNISRSFRQNYRTLNYGGIYPVSEQFYGRAIILGLRYNM